MGNSSSVQASFGAGGNSGCITLYSGSSGLASVSDTYSTISSSFAQNGGDILWGIGKGALLLWPNVLPQVGEFEFRMPTNHLGVSPGGLSSRYMLSLDADGVLKIDGEIASRKAKPLHRILCAWLHCCGYPASVMAGGRFQIEPGRGGENGRHGRIRFQNSEGRDLLRIEEGGFYADQTYLTTRGKVVDAFCSWGVALIEAGLRPPITPASSWP